MGKITICIYMASTIVFCRPALSACPDQLRACDSALSAAKDVITAQDESIAGLRKANQDLASRLADSQSRPLLPGWAWLAIGAATGVVTYGIVHGH